MGDSTRDVSADCPGMVPVARALAGCAAGALSLLLLPPPGPAAAAPALALSGDLTGLRPGATSVGQVTVRNRTASSVDLAEVAVVALPVGASCPGGALTVQPWRGALVVPAGDVVVVPVQVVLSASAAACTSWDLRYTAR